MLAPAALAVVSGFNSRTREGATKNGRTEPARNRVSIHAPVRVRRMESGNQLLATSFNSRTREGATNCIRELSVSEVFQFTHP